MMAASSMCVYCQVSLAAAGMDGRATAAAVADAEERGRLLAEQFDGARPAQDQAGL